MTSPARLQTKHWPKADNNPKPNNMTTQISIEEAISRVNESGKVAASHERVTELIGAICVPGYYVRQGDVTLTCVKAIPSDHKPGGERQLAPGTTQGSRHVAEGDAEMFSRPTNHPLEGPLMKVGDGGVTITHPEHRHYILPAGTCWGVTYHRDLASEELARVMD